MKNPLQIPRFLPNASDDVIEAFLSVMETLNFFEYGSFDEFEDALEMPTFTELNHINITDLYLFMMYQCEDLFTGRCWWRNKYMNCCSLFELQRSEYGICYSFNSVVNEVGLLRFQNEPSYPWRTSNYGDWSGLRIEINAAASNSGSTLNGVVVRIIYEIIFYCKLNFFIETKNLFQMVLHHPLEWPNSGYFIPGGSSTSVILKPTYSYTTADVKRLSTQQRQCIYEVCSTFYFNLLKILLAKK